METASTGMNKLSLLFYNNKLWLNINYENVQIITDFEYGLMNAINRDKMVTQTEESDDDVQPGKFI